MLFPNVHNDRHTYIVLARSLIVICSTSNLNKGLVINNGEGGLQNGKIAGPKPFCAFTFSIAKTFFARSTFRRGKTWGP